MEYFFAKHSIDLSVIGKFPQLEKMFDGFNMRRRYEAWGLYSEYRHTPLERVSGFQLKHHAKVTDWISAAQFGLDSALLSEKFYNLLQNFSCMKAIVVNAMVNHHTKSYPYEFIYFPEFQNHFVSFTRSRLYIAGSIGWVSDIQFENFEQFEKERNELNQRNVEYRDKQEYEKERHIRVVELFLDESKVNLDFFRLAGLINGFIVSERLKLSIEKEGLTGIRFSPVQGHKEQVWDTSVTPWREV